MPLHILNLRGKTIIFKTDSKYLFKFVAKYTLKVLECNTKKCNLSQCLQTHLKESCETKQKIKFVEISYLELSGVVLNITDFTCNHFL